MKVSYITHAATTHAVMVATAALLCITCAVFPVRAIAGPTTHTVLIQGMKFVPEALTVEAGDTVVWLNRDFFPHTATADDRSFDSRDIETNKVWKYIATKSGTFRYVCALHPTMKATLVVR